MSPKTGQKSHPFRTGQPVIYFHAENGTVRPILAVVGNVIFDMKGCPACSLKCTLDPIQGAVDARACLPISALENLLEPTPASSPIDTYVTPLSISTIKANTLQRTDAPLTAMAGTIDSAVGS